MWFSNKGIGYGTSIWLLLLPGLSGADSRPHRSAIDGVYNINTDLQSLLQDTTLSQDKELSETLAWINKLPTETSCTQLAAMKLMTECKLLDDPSGFAETHPEVHLDDIKLEYAVKLAVCEIAGAQPDQPHHALQNCEVFLPSTQACTKRSWWGSAQQSSSDQMPCYPQTNEKDLHLCFKTLRSSPQYWTSYSNAKFRAANMCQLSRHAIEREKTIQLHKNLTYVTFRLHSSLHGVETQMKAIQTELRESAEGFKKSSEGIKHSTDQFSYFVKEAHKEAAQERQSTKNEMRAVQKEVASVRDSIIAEITAHNARFNSQMDTAMTKAAVALRDGHFDTLKAISNELQVFYQTLQNEGSELALSMNNQLQDYHEKALRAIQIQHGAVVDSYSVMSTNLDDANQKIDGLVGKVDGLDEKTMRSLIKLDNLDHRLDGIGTKFKSVEQAFAVLDIVFGLGKVVIAIASVVTVLFVLPGKYLYKITSLIIISILLGAWDHGIGWHAPNSNVSPTAGNSTLPAQSSWAQHININIPSPYLWGAVAVSCFFLAASLRQINTAWEGMEDCLYRASFKSAHRFGILRQRWDRDSVLTLPAAEMPGV